MEDGQNVNFWTTIRWGRTRRAMLIVAPIAIVIGLTIGILTLPVIGCTGSYPDGTSVTRYGVQCLEPMPVEPVPEI
jgi:hypothetical protein